jgi:hypothetical protein
MNTYGMTMGNDSDLYIGEPLESAVPGSNLSSEMTVWFLFCLNFFPL